MNMYFCIEEDVLNPETCEVILTKGCVYSVREIETKRVVFGIDNFKSVVLFAECWDAACTLALEAVGV